MSRPVLEVQNLKKIYGTGEATVHALRGVSMTVHRGDYVAIMGSSGSGKSTLMNILGALDIPTVGSYKLDGVEVGTLSDAQLALARNRLIGFIFQAFNLIPRATAVANVELPLAYAGVKSGERRRRAMAALDIVGLADRADHEPNQLSGGQQQRVAVARALVTEPALLLADEPTGNLDSRSTDDVLQVFDDLSAAGRTIVIITHEDEVGARAKRLVRLVDGAIVTDVRQSPIDLPPVGAVAAHAGVRGVAAGHPPAGQAVAARANGTATTYGRPAADRSGGRHTA
ncbi:macrolide ABC transporter ATP-binding protein [Actinoplanes sp. SE50]|uniref:ABC transporter ATP-binding protein n=1 Tax=unclassified Actinoplanes TaxID=2626549 RepID=UPI00023ECE74|nr:ABC-type oligopeptide transport protein [Actinoplanes sp. SE50/110]ATO82032.1 macrolide ABC transporter ATP-binding protein [Actinoplanes sp. SE50]SLL99440.1 Macrolide export ATP-binding/permease protein MacB [Actinoplanes sp. SE50/110]